jgi:hypothetical protein
LRANNTNYAIWGLYNEEKTMISINQVITLAVAAATLLFASACGQSSSPALKVKVASLERCGATQPTIDLVNNTAKELEGA